MAMNNNKNWFSKVFPFCFILILAAIARFQVMVKAEDDAAVQLPAIQKLKDKLLKGYDSNIRPVTHDTNTTTVLLNVVPLYIVDLIEEMSLFQLDSWLFLSWHDYRLSWNESDYDGLTHIQLPDHLLWQPDITVYNGHSGSVDPMINTHLVLFSGGHVIFVPPALLDTLCFIETQGLYPNDKVTCQVIFGSWSHDRRQIDLQVEGSEMYLNEFENTNPRWELLLEETNIIRKMNKYNCCEEIYVTVKANFPMRRRPPPELQVIWAPCVLIMAIALLMFWIPPNSCKKIILGGFIFSALCLLIIYVAYVTKSPRFVKRAVTFLESTLYAITSAIIAEVLVINICSITGPWRPPEVLVSVLTNPLAKYAFIWAPWEAGAAENKMQSNEGGSPALIRHPTPNEEWILVATGLDRLFFFTYIIVLAAIHQI